MRKLVIQSDTHFGYADDALSALIEEACRQPEFSFDLGDQITGCVHPAEAEAGLVAWWVEQLEKEFMRACCGLPRPLDKADLLKVKGKA